MSANKNKSNNFREIRKTLSFANNNTANITGIGNVKTIVNEKSIEERKNVESLRTNSLSVSKITNKGSNLNQSAKFSDTKQNNINTWHVRMGHLNEKDLKRASTMVHGMKFKENEKL
ncbi:unnamed protein product [Ceratitis capitata]|uniref:(Mediterranean fruit fly) hypothetical protein n=1 Tax=Ceratitis capitata TaxID=7213 RepID=A0A811US05_CERCA|nr:unnamed protein product [Ceratitis capitata]